MLISNTSERLRQLMQDRNLRQADILEKVLPFCEQYGIRMNRSDISQYLSGKVVPSQRKLSVLSKALNVQEPWLIGYDVPMTVEDQIPLASILPTKQIKIRLLNAPSQQSNDSSSALYIDLDVDTHCDFALIAEDDSMSPTIKAGDIVFIRKQDAVNDGQIASVIIDDHATLKRIYHIPNGVQLISENPTYPPQTYSSDAPNHVTILGKAVAYKRML